MKIKLEKLSRPDNSIQEKIRNLQKIVIFKTNAEDYTNKELENVWKGYQGPIQFKPEIINITATTDESDLVGISGISKPYGLVISCFVHPDYQQQGIGRRLIQALESETHLTYLWVLASVSSKLFYEKMGYTTLMRGRINGGVRVFLMKKTLNKSILNVFRDWFLKVFFLFSSIIITIKANIQR